jgi:hypothetical protein
MTDVDLTLDQWLAKLYQVDIRLDISPTMSDFKVAIAASTDLRTEATTRLTALDGLVVARGEGACAYSTKYRSYLREALS